MPVGKLAPVRLVVSDELGERVRRYRRMHGERERRNRDIGDRFEILNRIIERPRL
jgi:hypothetical protein